MFRLAGYSYNQSTDLWSWVWCGQGDGTIYEFQDRDHAEQASKLYGNLHLNGNIVVRELPEGLSEDEKREHLPTHVLEFPRINP